MSVNPFHFNVPTPPQDFVGRKALLENIIGDLQDVSGDSYAIVGGRRFGKSSLLLAIERRLSIDLKGTEIGDYHVLPVFLSLKSAELASASAVLGLFLHSIRKATSCAKKALPFEGPILELDLPEYTQRKPHHSELDELEDCIEELVSAAYCKIGLLRIALIVDEMDCVLDFPWTGLLFGLLRSLIYDGRVRDYVRLVLAGSGRYLDVDERGSPLLNAVKACYLEAFTEDEISELVRRAPDIPRDILVEVTQQGGGHPFILQHLLHYLVEGIPPSPTSEDVQAEVRRFVHDRSADLEGWWYAIGEDGRRIYFLLADSGTWMSQAELSQAAEDPYLQVDRGLKALCYHGLIVHDGKYQRYRISGDLFRDWALQRARAPSKMTSREVWSNPQAIHQQARKHGIQFGQVSGGTIIIGRESGPQPARQLNPEQRIQLHSVVQVLKSEFDREEFRTLCFNIGIHYDWLAPGELESQASELVLGCERTGCLETLIAEVRRLRPGSI